MYGNAACECASPKQRIKCNIIFGTIRTSSYKFNQNCTLSPCSCHHTRSLLLHHSHSHAHTHTQTQINKSSDVIFATYHTSHKQAHPRINRRTDGWTDRPRLCVCCCSLGLILSSKSKSNKIAVATKRTEWWDTTLAYSPRNYTIRLNRIWLWFAKWKFSLSDMDLIDTLSARQIYFHFQAVRFYCN